ncbi:MAG TPA: helix-turn-helix transcriptional regulator [Terriglobia bacterium]|nr:helix-turn-helix transcriptional regulator [Terriglobia bacterium]
MSPGLIINDRIKAIRERKRLSASELARMAGVNPSEISQIESGRKRSPRLDTVQRIARALDVSIDYLSGQVEHEGSLARALALEALNLYLRESKLDEDEVRGLLGVVETEAAPIWVEEWGKFVVNLRSFLSNNNGTR